MAEAVQATAVRRAAQGGSRLNWTGLDRLSDRELVARARCGNDDALECLLTRYRSFARSRARSYFLPGSGGDDLIQEAMIGLFRAVKGFDADRGVPFGAFASVCVSRQLFSAIKGATSEKHDLLNRAASLDAPPAPKDQMGAISLGEQVREQTTDPADLAIAAEEMEAVRDFLKRKLTRLESDVVRLYAEGRSYAEIADTLGNGIKAVDNALQRVRYKLERDLDARDPERVRRLWDSSADPALVTGRLEHR